MVLFYGNKGWIIMDNEQIKDTAFIKDDPSLHKPIEAVPSPDKEIGIDLNNTVIDTIMNTIETNKVDMNAIESFTQVSQSRDRIYDVLDDMGNDSTIAAVLETYAEDATEPNDKGNIMWCESDDSNIIKFVSYLLEALNVDKNMYKWAYSLCKYGDVYLRLYRESDYDEDLLFGKRKKHGKSKNTLTEDVKLNYYGDNDRYVHYLEMVDNPAEAFELTRFGKTAAYIQTPSIKQNNSTDLYDGMGSISMYKYRFSRNEVNLYPPTEFVHGSLEDNSSRTPEEVELFLDDKKSMNYKVKRGQSLLYSTYKIWRQLMLLENSVLLNRVTQSSIVRVIGVEVGDMPKENVQPHLMNVKQLIEQKASLDVNKSMSEYTNPGPVVNNVYIPTRNNQGVLTTQQIGGDVKIGDLSDLDYYQDKFFGNLRVPKQYFGVTDDNAGFSGGESLSIISSRYAKMIKRIQNTLIQMITDAINLICIDTGNESYVNKFRLKMQTPTTEEEVKRRDNLSNKVGLVRDIMDTLSDVEHVPTKLKILKNLLSDTVTDPDIIEILQDEIDKLEAEEVPQEEQLPSEPDKDETNEFPDEEPMDLNADDNISIPTSEPVEHPESSEDSLPSPADLDIGDMSDMTNPNL